MTRTIGFHSTLANLLGPKMAVIALVVLVIGLVCGVWFFGTRMVRAHSKQGFRYLHCVNVMERRPVEAQDILVAFDVSMVEERDRRLEEWSER